MAGLLKIATMRSKAYRAINSELDLRVPTRTLTKGKTSRHSLPKGFGNTTTKATES